MDPRQGFATTRLTAEPASARHASSLARALADPAVHVWTRDAIPTELDFARQFEFVSTLPESRSPDGAEIWLTWTLFLKTDPANAIGYIQATIRAPERVTIAYVLGKPFWRQGYAREAVTAMLDFVFKSHDLACAVAEVDTRNAPSMAFAEALGMRRIDSKFAVGILRGAAYDDHIYAISRDDWLTRGGKSGQ